LPLPELSFGQPKLCRELYGWFNLNPNHIRSQRIKLSQPKTAIQVRTAKSSPRGLTHTHSYLHTLHLNLHPHCGSNANGKLDCAYASFALEFPLICEREIHTVTRRKQN